MLVVRGPFETGQRFLVAFEAVEDVALADIGVSMRVVERERILVTGQRLIEPAETFERRALFNKRVDRVTIDGNGLLETGEGVNRMSLLEQGLTACEQGGDMQRGVRLTRRRGKGALESLGNCPGSWGLLNNVDT